MVAIVTGTGFGLDRSSAQVLGSRGMLGQSDLGRSGLDAFINAATGQLNLRRTDEILIGNGNDQVLTTDYSGSVASWSPGGVRGLFAITGPVNVAGSTVSRVDEGNNRPVFTYDAGRGCYVSKEGGGAYDEIRFQNDVWSFKDGDTQNVEYYERSAAGGALFFITRSVDQDGNTQTFSYNSDNTVSRITNADGGYTDILWSNSRPTEIKSTFVNASGQTVSRTRVRYVWDASYRLLSHTVDLSPDDNSTTDGNVYVTNYTYDGTSKRITSITQTDGSRLDLTYWTNGTEYRVATFTQTVAAGVSRTTSFDYTIPGRTTVTDPASQKTVLFYDANNNLTQINYPPENANTTPRIVQFTYNANGDVATATLGPGNVVHYAYDQNGNLVTERDSAGNTIRRTYGAKNELLTETRFLVPDPDGDGAGQAATPVTIRYAYDVENHLRYAVSAEGHVTQYDYDASGRQIRAIDYASNAYNIAGLAYNVSIAESTLNSWVVGIADKSTTRRTETVYDPRGAVQKVTSYSKLQADGSFDLSSERTETNYVYDPFGTLLSRQVTGAAASEVFVYDGIGRMTMATDLNGGVTRTTFLDALGQTVLTHANGLSEVSTYNRAGELISYSKSNAGGNLVDLNNWPGNPASVPSGQATVAGWNNHSSFTDETQWASTIGPDGLPVVAMRSGQQDAAAEGGGNFTNYFTIDGSKAYEFTYYFKLSDLNKHHAFFGLSAYGATPWVEYAHNGVDETNPYFFASLIGTQQTLTADKWYKVVGYVLPEGATAPAGSLGGVYDAQTGEKVAGTTNVYRWNVGRPDNIIHARFFNYNGEANQQYSTYFYQPEVRQVSIPAVTVPQESTSLYRYDNLGQLRMTIDPTGRHNHMMYDSVGRKIADIDADGSVIEYRYDGSDNLTSTTRYANRLTTNQLASLIDGNGNPTGAAFSSLRPAAHADDQWSFQVYDAAQRLIQTIDATGAVTVFTYDGASRLVSTKSYANKLAAATLTALKAEAGNPNLWANPGNGTTWNWGNLSRVATGTTIEGVNAYQFTVLTSGAWQGFASSPFMSAAGDTISYTISMKAVGSVTTESFGVVGYVSGWGANSISSGAIVSGPGTLTQAGGGLWTISGLSTSDATRVTITRQILQNENAEAYFYVKDSIASNSVAGDSVIAAAPVYLRTRSTAVNLPAAHADDRVTRNFHDNDGRVIATLDGAGGLTQFVYDEAGRKIRDVGSAKAASSSLWAAGTLAQLITSVGTSTADRRVDYVYDARGFQRFAIDATARPTEMGYDAAGNVIRTVEYKGSIAPAASYSLAYVTAQLASTGLATHADNRITRAVYNTAGQMMFSIDAAGGVTGFAYDSVGNVVKQIRYAAAVTLSGDPTLAAMQSWASSQSGATWNRVSRNVYDVFGRVAYTVDAENYVTEHQYDRAGRATKTIRYADPYTVADGVTKESLAAQIGTLPASAVVVTYAHDSDGRRSETIDGTGAVTRFGYDSFGRLVDTTIAHGTADASTLHRVYDLLGRVTSETAAYGTAIAATTEFDYDSLGNLIEVRDPLGHKTLRIYDTLGRVRETWVQVDATNYLKTKNEYDAFGNLVKVIDPRDSESFLYYDALGRVTLQSDNEKFLTQTSYTVFGEVYQVTRRYLRGGDPRTIDTKPTVNTHAKDATTTFAYDKRGLLQTVTDAMGHSESYTLDAFGDRIAVTNKTNGATGYTYDRRGLLRYEGVTMSAYLSDGTLQSSSFNKTILDYDAFGNLISKTEAYALNGQRDTLYAYDKANRLVISAVYQAIDTVGTDLQTVTALQPHQYFAYNARGQLIQSIDPAGGKTQFYYDALGRKTHEVNAVGMLSTWTYHANGNVDTMRVYGNAITIPGTPGGTPPAPVDANNYRLTSYAHDFANRLTGTTVHNVRTGSFSGSAYTMATDGFTTLLAYDKAGNVVKETDGNGNATFSWYDKLGRKVAQVDRENYLTIWSRDANGNAALLPDGSYAERRYANRVTGSFSEATALATLLGQVSTHADDRITNFDYDKNGRRLTETRLGVVASSVSVAGALTTAAAADATVTYTYNALGLVATKTEANGDLTHFEYDVYGRLTRTKDPTMLDHNGTSVRRITENFYDGLGNLVRIEVNKEGGAAGDDRVTRFNYGAGGILASTQDAAGFTRSFGYDIAGRVVKESWTRLTSDGTTSVTEAIGYRYDAAGRVVTQTTATWNGSAWTFGDAVRIRYNAYGEVNGRGVTGSPNDTAVYQETFDYDAGGRLWRSNESDGSSRLHLHDKAGNRTLTLSSTGADLATVGQSTFPTLIGAAGQSLLASSVTTLSVFDKRGQQLATREPDRQLYSDGAGGFITTTIIASRAYNAFGEVASETDARSFTTDFTYNKMGRLIKKESPGVAFTAEDGTVDSFERPTEDYYYDISGRMVAIRDANGFTTRRALLAGSGHNGEDALITAKFDAANQVSRTSYDVFRDARVLRNELFTGANGADTDEIYTYDKMGRVTNVRHRGATGYLVDDYVYDGLGRRIRHWNNELGSGNVERTDYDAQGRVTGTIAFGGDPTTITYSWNASLATSGMATFGGWTQTTTFANSKTLIEQKDLFGRNVSKTDLGGHVFTYAFDKGARLVSQAVGSETTAYSWFNTGLLYQAISGTNVGHYGYDAAGNKIIEATIRNSVVAQSAGASYDALGRMTGWTENGGSVSPAASMSWQYDLKGNIRKTTYSYYSLDGAGAPAVQLTNQTYWYRFDALDRVVVDKGVLSGGTITHSTQQGTTYTYDAAGRRTSATIVTPQTVSEYWWVTAQGLPLYPVSYDPEPPYGAHQQMIQSGFIGERRETFSYRADGVIEQVWIAESGYDWQTGQSSGLQAAKHKATFTNDKMGRLTRQQDWAGNGPSGGAAYDRQVTYNAKSQITGETVNTLRGTDTFTDVITNTYGSGASYALGAVLTVTADASKNGSDSAAPDHVTTNVYQYWDGAVATTTTYDPDNSSTNWVTTHTYSASGQLTSASIADGRPRTVTFTNDMAGQVIRRDETDNDYSKGDPHEVFYRFDGREMGYSGNNGTLDTDYFTSIANRTKDGPGTVATGAFRWGQGNPTSYADFDPSIDKLNSFDQGSNTGGYTARGGETLQQVAANLWGDASLWYKLAEANGMAAMGPGATLAAGQQLVIPAGAMSNSHNAETFGVYDPNKGIGDLSPTSPKPAKKGKNCGMIGQIILLAVSAAISMVLPPLAPVLGPVLGSMATAAIVSAGTQAFGVATGIQDKFDWKGVALAAISAGVTAGLSQGLGGIKGPIGELATQQSLFGSKALGGLVHGAVTGAISEGIGVATGLKDKFDWAGVAASAVGNSASSAVNLKGPFGMMAKFAADGLASAATRSLITGTSFGDNIVAVLPSVIGRTIGNLVGESIAGAVQGSGSQGSTEKDVIAAKDAEAAGIIAGKEADGPLALNGRGNTHYLMLPGAAGLFGMRPIPIDLNMLTDAAMNQRAQEFAAEMQPIIDSLPPELAVPAVPIPNEHPLPNPATVEDDGTIVVTGPRRAGRAQRQRAGTLSADFERLAAALSIGEGNYESYNTGTWRVPGGRVGHSYINPPPGTVTGRTIDEILSTSSLPGTDRRRLFAVGRYQIVQRTLREAVAAMGLTGNELMTPEMQDRIFSEYLVGKAGGGVLRRFIVNGRGTVDQAQYAAAKEWASIAAPRGYRTDSGRISDGRTTYHDRTPANRASTRATNALRTFLMDLHRRRHP